MQILIADDESIIRMGLKRMLQEMGHEVLAAKNGRLALQLARQHQPDLAILDIHMPYTDGLQAAKTISRTQPIPILLLTAYSEADLIEQATDLPVQGYLVKPITAAELTAAIAIARKRFDESQALAQQAAALQADLETRKLVEQAKGRLMETMDLTEKAAYQTLQKVARDKQLPMAEVAKAVLKGRKA